MKRMMTVLASVLVLATVATAADQVVESKIERVTLYRGTAMVTRMVTVPAGEGEMALVVGDLPPAINPQSLNAAGNDAVSVRSVRFRTRAVKTEPNAELAELQAQFKNLSREMQKLQAMSTTLAERKKYLDSLEGFTAPTAKGNLAEAKLDPKALIEVSEYIFEKRQAITTETLDLSNQQQDLHEEIQLVQRKINELAADGSKTLREAVIFAQKSKAGATKIALSYLVSNAGWAPSYKAILNNEKIDLAYVARVSQTSGEDWSGVTLTLSTASPQMNAEIPLLVPMWVQLTPEHAGNKQAGLPQDGRQMDIADNGWGYIQSRQNAQLQTWQGNGISPDNRVINWELNSLANARNRYELNLDLADIVRVQEQARSAEAALAVTYEIDSPMSLESRNDVQLVEIAAKTLDADSYYQACPLLGGFVFRGADVVNTTGIPLLAGTYDAYIGNEFVGRGSLPLVAKGQPLSLGFGVDTQLRCSRELKDKTDKTFLGSRVQTFEYVLRVESFKAEPVTVRLVDRMPTTQDDDMDIKFKDSSQELATTGDSAQRDREQGLLTWDVTVPAGSIGDKAKTVTYEFEMKFASDRSLGRMLMEKEEKAKAAFNEAYDAKR